MTRNVERRDGGPLTLSVENFDEVISSEKPVIVDFWAEWCAPCRYMHPIFEKLSKEYGDRITFARVNVDENQELAARFRIFSIPTFAIFRQGRLDQTQIGAVGEGGLKHFLKHYL